MERRSFCVVKRLVTSGKLDENKLSNIDNVSNDNTVVVAIDAEWDTSASRTARDDVRNYSDVISIQLAIKGKNCPLYECMLLRDTKDPAFIFDDVFKVVREYFENNGIPKKKVMNKSGRFKGVGQDDKVEVYPFVLAGFFMGVDISVFSDWDKVFDSTNDNIVNLRQQAVASTSDLAVSVDSRAKHTKRKGQTGKYVKNYALITLRDTILLAPPKANLDAVGSMVNYPKLDTEEWDQQDGKPAGYYKSHMRDLLAKRRKDYMAYAMTDSEIVLAYVDQLYGVVDSLNMLSDRQRHELPFASGSLAACVAATYSNRVNDVLAKGVWNWLHMDSRNSIDYYHANTFKLQELQQCVLSDSKGNPKLELDGSESVDDLADCLDWDMLRKGYYMPLSEEDTDVKHRAGQKDMSAVEATSSNRDAFKIADKAYYGGHNVAYTHGLITGKRNGRKFIDIDAKSAYNTGGHLMPDFITGVGMLHFDQFQLDDDWINRNVQRFNSVFMVGVGECWVEYDFSKQHYNYDQHFVFTPYRSSAKDTPRYVRHAGDYMINTQREACFMTLTDMLNAYENGASVFVKHLYIPMQDVLRDHEYMDHVFPTGVAQDLFAKMRAQYPKSNPYNSLYKMLGNSVYGKTGQGIHKTSHKSYQDGLQYYLPMSVISNPFVAAQYTAITRYIVMRLIKVAEKIEPSLKVESITTDGFLSSVNDDVDIDAFEDAFNKALHNEDPRWVYVAEHYFNGEFYEIKGITRDDLFDVRTRFQLTGGNHEIHALAGIKNCSEDSVYNDLRNGVLQVPMKQSRMSSLTDEKHNATYKHLMRTTNMTVNGYLNYDFTRKLTTFHPGLDGYGYWDTEPFDNIDEQIVYREYGLLLSRNWCLYDNKQALLFKGCISQLMGNKKDARYKASDKDTLHENEDYQLEHLLRYFVAYKPNANRRKLYDTFFCENWNTYKSFVRAWRKRSKDVNNLFINYLAISDLVDECKKLGVF